MKSQKGFTLIELMVTLGVAAIVLSIGIPSFRTVIMNNRLVTQSNQFVTSVNLARSSAVRYQRNATVCASANYDAAVPICSASTDWSNGYIVWVDKDRDATTDADEVLAVFAPMSSTLTFSSGGTAGLTYNARGFSLAGGDDMVLCDSRTGEMGRIIRINAVGRANIKRQVCS